MGNMRFDEVLDAVEQLPVKDKEILLEILKRRCLAYRRAELRKEIDLARREFRKGQCSPRTAEELMKEILS